MLEQRLGRARAVWTDRHGGVSSPPYDTANLASSVDDAPDAVAENRRRLADALEVVPPGEWGWLQQVHGADVVIADTPRPEHPPAADAAITTTPGLPVVVLTADCAPIAIACDGAAGVVHAGWHGVLAGVIEAAVSRLRTLGGDDVRAAIGPCIHPGRYEFGAQDLARLTDRLGTAVAGVTVDGRPALDLPAAVRAAFDRVGVTNVDDVGICTASSPDHFSYRRDGVTGRQGLVVVLDA